MHLIWLLLLCAPMALSSTVKVSTGLGDILGVQMKSRLGADYNAFRGIRYAKAPVGELRFESPQPVEAWKPDVFDATEDGPKCPQGAPGSEGWSEDCLRLNVYSKDLSANASKPVIVFIHPGGFSASSGQSGVAGAEILMDYDVVLVTFNYRLGMLGFLATGTKHAPGNAAMKDQVLVLRWVRDHIRNFGGDPNSVTLFGYSAGSRSVGLHMVSPMSKGLFHRGICMSASPVMQLLYGEDQLELAKRQARLVGCPTDDLDEMIKCLKKTPVDEFLRTSRDMYDFGYNPMLNWKPVVEKDCGQERFLVEEPLASYQAGRIQKTPLIIGTAKDEFARIIYYTLKDADKVKDLNENWNKLAPIMMQYERDTPRSHNISATLRREYLGNQPLVKDGPFEPMAKLYSDGLVGFPIHRFAHLAARFVPVYYYRYSFKGRFSDFKYPGDTAYGSVHHAELQFLLHVPRIAPLFKSTDPEYPTMERFCRMWTKFFRTGDPNNPKDEYLKDLKWEPLNLKKENYLDIGQELVNREGLFLERFNVWDKLFPLDWCRYQTKPNPANPNYPEVA